MNSRIVPVLLALLVLAVLGLALSGAFSSGPEGVPDPTAESGPGAAEGQRGDVVEPGDAGSAGVQDAAGSVDRAALVDGTGPVDGKIRVRGRLVDGRGQPREGIAVGARLLSAGAVWDGFLPPLNPDTAIRDASAEDGTFELLVPADRRGRVEPIEGEDWVIIGDADFPTSSQDVDLGDLVTHGASWVSGVVRGPRGEPLEGVELAVAHGGILSWGGLRSGATSAEDGSFRLAGLSPGKHELRTASPMHLPVSEPVELEPGLGVDGMEITLQEGRAIAGRVVDDLGRPIAGATVTASRVRQDGGVVLTSFRAGESSKTDVGGYFVLGGLTGDSVSVRGWHPEFVPFVEASIAVGSQRLQFEMSRYGGIRGRLLSEAGEPIGNSAIHVDSEGPRSSPIGVAPGEDAEVHTEEDGTFFVPKVQPGNHTVRATGAHQAAVREGVAVVAGGTVENINLEARLGGAFDVVVLDPDGEPLEGAEVSVGKPSPAPDGTFRTLRMRSGPGGELSPFDETKTHVTDSEGRVRIAGLEPEGYELTARHDDFADSQKHLQVAPAVGSVEVQLKVREGGRVELVVTNPDGSPALEARYRVAGAGVSERGMTNAEGRAVVGPLTPGEYGVVLEVPPRPLQLGSSSFVTFGGDQPEIGGTQRSFAIKAGETVTVPLVRPILTVVRGTVSDASGRVVGASVSLSEEGAAGGPMGGGPSSVTGPDGTFEIKNITPGTYTIEWGRKNQIVKHEEELEVLSGTPVVERQLMLTGGTVKVMAEDENGDPVEGANVSLRRVGQKARTRRSSFVVRMVTSDQSGGGGMPETMDFRMGGARAATDEGGVAEIVDVPPGRYTLSVSHGRFQTRESEEFVVADGAVRDVGRLLLDPAARISGKILQFGTAQLGEIGQIEYRMADEQGWQSQMAPSGSFSIEGLTPGVYKMRASKLGPGRTPTPGPEIEVELRAGRNRPVELRLK